MVESDFVSGNESRGWSTPAGAYPLTYKQRNATLKGQNYSTPVSYWMPFNGGIGMHDAYWRSSFGGKIYKTNGSHGCINLPPAVAKTVYENISAGMPCSAIICRAPKAVQPAPQPRMAARQRLRRSHSRHSLLIQRADREARMRLRPVIRAALPSHLRQLSQLQRHSPLRQQLSQLQQLSRPRQRPSRLQRHPPAMVPPRPIRDRTAQLHRLLPAVHLPAVRVPDPVGPRVLRVVPAIHREVHPAPA